VVVQYSYILPSPYLLTTLFTALLLAARIIPFFVAGIICIYPLPGTSVDMGGKNEAGGDDAVQDKEASDD
jgi:hypothetical protein